MSERPTLTRKSGRSPNYPGIDLKLALERARILWEQEQHHVAPNELILKHWGYGPKSGGGSVAFAATKRFGLLEDIGGGKARLTQRAQTILLAEREGRAEQALIREAALLPAVHKEMWEEFGNQLPSDESLKYKLQTEKGFTAGGATEFVSVYKRTLQFAGLLAGNGGIVPPTHEDKRREELAQPLTPPATITPDPTTPAPTPPATAGRVSRTVQVPYSPSEWALVQASFPMTEQDWNAMLAVLQAMKMGLVAPPVAD